MASRHAALLALLKLSPGWLVTALLRSGLLPRLSPVFRMATTSHSRAAARLTANRDLRALLGYLFYGQRLSRQGGRQEEEGGGWYRGGGGGCVATGGATIAIRVGNRGGKGRVVTGRGRVKLREGCVATVEGYVVS